MLSDSLTGILQYSGPLTTLMVQAASPHFLRVSSMTGSVQRSSDHQEILSYLDLVIRARYPLLFLVSPEEAPVEELIKEVAEKTKPVRKVLSWNMVQGWEDNGQHKAQAMPALERVAKLSPDDATICVFKDLHLPLMSPHSSNNYPIIRSLKILARETARRTVILVSHIAAVPDELREELVVVDFPLPGLEEIHHLLAASVSPEKLRLSELGREQLVRACQGLTRNRIRRILSCALASHSQVDESDIDLVLEEKKQYIRQTEILEFYSPKETLKSVGGLENLKAWVQQRRNSFSDQARSYGLPNPKGVLLVGIQGTGKSLSAKTIAKEWRMPLLKLDAGRLFGGIVGESESRVRQMTQISEAMAPCVLWIDEIDKAFGGVGGEFSGDSGTSKRVFGSLITWMQEKTKPVFIVATANNVQVLPAELLRKGRFDEIFFLNLPTESERRDIFQVHLGKVRPNRIRDFDLEMLARLTPDFSGAEIEQAVYDAMHRAFNHATPSEFTQSDLVEAIEQTVPLASIARDQIEELKEWAAQSGARTASKDEALMEELAARSGAMKRGIGHIEVDDQGLS